MLCLHHSMHCNYQCLPMKQNALYSIVAQCMLLTLHNTACNSVYQFSPQWCSATSRGDVHGNSSWSWRRVHCQICDYYTPSIKNNFYCWSRLYSQSELPIHLLQNSTMLSCWIAGLCKKGPSSEQNNNECKQKLPNYSIVLVQSCIYIHMLEWVCELQTPAKVEKS